MVFRTASARWSVSLLALVMAASGPLAAQPVPPTPPASQPVKPAQPSAKPSDKTTKPPAKPATTKPPTVKPKPGTSPQRPANKPAAPAPVPAVPPPPAQVEPAKPPEPTKGSSTNEPLPRFVSLRSDEVYMRTGPGRRYPIEWVYKRRDLPVLIEREFEFWRLVSDPEGTKGWIHKANLIPRRGAVVTGEERPLRQDPRDDSPPVARLKPGVILRLRSCEATSDWCQAQVQEYRGWIKRSEIWGTLPGEAVQ